MEQTLSLSEAKAKLNSLVDAIIEHDNEFILTRNGKPVAVLVSPELFESFKETKEIQANLDLVKEIKKGLQRMKAGGKRYFFEDIFGES